jgi:peptidoglycan-N-acetylglucosamine deacetylase
MRLLVGAIVAALALMGPAGAQQIAITIDDLPAHGPLPPGMTRLGIAESILKTLKGQHMPPVYGFINAEAAGGPGNEEVLTAWRSAGEPLGSHTWSHVDLNAVSATGFEANIEENEPMLRKLMGNEDWHWFRYPYLHEGGTLEKRRAVRAWLGEHRYRVAEVNMDFGDYLWNDPYARCMVKHDDAAIRKLHDSYLATADEYIGVFRKLSQIVYGRDVKYILLMHIGAFDAKMLPELLELYRKRGFTFISLQEAEQDPIYKDDLDIGSVGGGAQLEQMMDARKLDYPKNTKPFKELENTCK